MVSKLAFIAKLAIIKSFIEHNQKINSSLSIKESYLYYTSLEFIKIKVSLSIHVLHLKTVTGSSIVAFW